MSKCVVCKQEVKWKEVQEIFEHVFDQADHYGVESLTEHQQVIYHGMCCSDECYQRLE